MKQEYIDLLRKDIAARLPYKPVVTNEKLDGGYGHRLHLGDLATSRYIDSLNIENTKVYLRPMLSMTVEELREYNYLYAERENNNELDDIEQYSDLIDWLNAHHIDYHGLIERGLAIEVTEENNPYVHRTYADIMKAKEKQ